ncbi:metalloprotease family M17 [Achlya hypogyna]|uniref:Metalloprotease family M17 n=1 Tax=Achlya hypogyna TaxID=1202772 RepID=A0A1V9ZMX6_ACHHY|nr:metalloprotease family M17 [Achlya hypogyna]
MVRYVELVAQLPVSANPVLLLVGTKETPGVALAQRILDHLAGDAVDTALLAHAVAELSPSTDNAASAHLYLPLKDDVVLSVVVAQLPTAVSRHNSVARPHALMSLVKAHASDIEKDTIVALSLPDHDATWVAAGTAVAKAMPAYFHKSTAALRGVITTGAATAFAADNVHVVFDERLAPEQVAYLNCSADGIHLTQRLVDAPPNELNTTTFVAEARAVAARTGAEITVIEGEELRERGFGGLYGVGQAAAHPPALVVLSHYPNEAAKTKPSRVLVGKGIVYDTGGLSLKISGGMVGMKDDMGGAAGLLGAFLATVTSGAAGDEFPLHCILCLAENAVGPLATRPDDVHTMYSGKTVEINNTDAEGRLVLADGVAYAAKHLDPAFLLDMATLTGAAGIVTGAKIASMYANTDAVEAFGLAAGKASGDFVHPVPYVPEFYRPEYKSAIADMKNLMANTRNAGVSCGGQFIGNHMSEFVERGQWLHVDMGFPVAHDDHRATGYGEMVRYLASIEHIARAASLPKIVLIGTKETPGLALGTRILSKLRTPLDPSAVRLLTHAIDELAPCSDAPVSSHLYLPLGGDDVISCTVAKLPTAVSRHNSFARPHAITSVLKAASNEVGKKTLVGLDLPTHPTLATWKTGAFAVARAVPAYMHKSTEQRGIITDGSATAFAADSIDVVFSDNIAEADVVFLNATADGIHLTQRLVDAPPNELTTTSFVAEARAVAARTGAEITVIEGEVLRERGFGGLYGVGKAATHPPALVVLSHYPNEEAKAKPSTVLVGKGLVYDTGGLDLKISGGMVGMKADMGGAAGLLGAFQAAVSSGNTGARPLHCVLCLAENAIGPHAIRPDEVHTFYSGKTVEVNDTDAEGRLVLADGVAYATKHLNPGVLLDMATLTGAQGVATGQHMGALYCNTDELEALAVKAGKESGDLVHPVPYVPEFYRPEYKSAIADMKNYMTNPRNAGVSCGGQFIGNHISDFVERGQWLHVDMASPVQHSQDKRATGYGVAFVQTLLQLLRTSPI